MKNILFALFCFSQLIGSDIEWTFPPDTLSTSGISAATPRISMDANGDVVAVWIENGFVKAKSKPVNMNWGSAVTLSGSGASAPKVVSDLNGNSTAVWVQNGNVKASSKTLNGTWSAAVTLFSGSTATSPSLAVDVAGDVVAAWATNGIIQAAIKLFGANWQNSVTITTPGNNAVFPNVAIGGSGSNTRAVIAWHSTAGSVAIVYASTKLVSSGSWSSATPISNVNFQSAYAHVAVDTNGNATAVWYTFRLNGSVYSSVVVQSATKSAAGNWGPIASLSSPGITNPANLVARVAYDVSGNAVALWSTSFNDESLTIESAIRPVYGEWTESTELVDANLYSYQPAFAVASLGDAIALYMFYNGVALQIQSSELDITGFMNSAWSVPLNISTGTENANPYVAATVTGNVINSAAVWISSNGMFNSVAASTGVKTLVLPPSSLTVTQSNNNFDVFTEYYNTLSWVASTDPTVVGYLVYRNGTFISQVGSDVTQFIDNNRAQNGPVTYGVAAIDDQMSHSRIITVAFP